MTWSPDHTFVVEGGGEPPPADPTPSSRPGMAPAHRSRHRPASRAASSSSAAPSRWRPSGSGPSSHRPWAAACRRRSPSPSTAAGPSPTPAGSATAGALRAGRRRNPCRASRRRPARSSSPTGSATSTSTRTTTPYPTLEQFTAETGIEVDYVESVDGNEEFFTTQPQGPARRRPADRLGPRRPDRLDDRPARPPRLARAVRSRPTMPNFVANLLPLYVGRSFDPDTKFAAPWQSGMTGLGFDQNETGPLTSLDGPLHRRSSPGR